MSAVRGFLARAQIDLALLVTQITTATFTS
jgi:hypothetical protein